MAVIPPQTPPASSAFFQAAVPVRSATEWWSLCCVCVCEQSSRAALQRYLFYCNRYMNHMQSLKFENRVGCLFARSSLTTVTRLKLCIVCTLTVLVLISTGGVWDWTSFMACVTSYIVFFNVFHVWFQRRFCFLAVSRDLASDVLVFLGFGDFLSLS